jgi:hypothetical protein
MTLGFTKFFMQMGDQYTYRPNDSDYYNIDVAKAKLSQTKLKLDWGMVWCK